MPKDSAAVGLEDLGGLSNLNDPVIPQYQIGQAILAYNFSMKLNSAVQYVTVPELINWINGEAVGNNSEDNNQALFSPSPSRPGELRDEAAQPGVSERGTRSGAALWDSPPPRRYDGDSLSPAVPQDRRSSCGISTGICSCINYLGL